MKQSILVQLLLCNSSAAAFVPSLSNTQRSFALNSHPFTTASLIESETVEASPRIGNKHEPVRNGALASGLEKTSNGANDKASTVPLRMIPVQERTGPVWTARDKPVTKAKEGVKESPRRRTLTPMEKILASEEAVRAQDSIKPTKVGRDAPFEFFEKPAPSTPRTGKAGQPVAFKAPNVQPTMAFDLHESMKRRMPASTHYAEKPASVTPVTGSRKDRAMEESMVQGQQELEVYMMQSTEEPFTPNVVTPSPRNNGHAHPYNYPAVSDRSL